MKKTLKLFGLVALAAIAFSCTKKDNPVTPGTPTDVTTPTEEEQTTPSIVPATDGGLLTSFGVTIGSEATKVSVNLTSGETAIEENDEALVFASDGNSATYVYDGTQFVLKDGETAVTVNTATGVYYPATEYEAGSAVQLVLPAGIEASGDLGAINPMAGVITGEEGNYSVTLNNLTSVLRVKVSADVNINSVALDFGSVNYAAGAKFTVNPTTSELTFASGTATSETIALGTPAQTADVLFLLPALNLTNGLTVTANLAENHNGGADSFSISKEAYTPTVNKISSMSFYAGLFSGGAGTATDPYIIAKARDFKHISEYCKNGYEGITAADFLAANYVQTNNIDFKDAALSEYMIGADGAPFTGMYDGQSYNLTNFSISGTEECTGLWRVTSGATLKKVKVTSSTVESTAGIVGSLVGRADNGLTLDSCISTATVTASGQTQVGGLVGLSTGGMTIKGCVNQGSVTGANYTGGLVGHINTEASSTIGKNSSDMPTYNRGTVSGGSAVGGIVGETTGNTTITDGTYNAGDITGSGQNVGGLVGRQNKDGYVLTINGGSSNGIPAIESPTSQITIKSTRADAADNQSNVGGLVGNVEHGTIAISGNCFNRGDVTGSAMSAGGIVGRIATADCVISECINYGNISTTGTKNSNNYTGGILGCSTNGKDATIISCTNNGDVTSTKTFVGGIAGRFYNGTIDLCVNAGNLNATASNANNVGGITGGIYTATVKRCYSAKGITIEGGTRVAGIVGTIEQGGKVVSCASYSFIKGHYTSSLNNAIGIGFIVGVENNADALIANCVAFWDKDDDADYSLNSGKSTENKVTGGLVGAKNSGTLQNSYCQVPCNKIGFQYNTSTGIVRGHSTATNGKPDYIGQIAGRNTAGDIIDCYYGGWAAGSTTGVRPIGTLVAGDATYVTRISSGDKVAYDHASFVPVAVTTSTGINFAANTVYLKDILDGGLTSGTITGYTPATGEVLTWSNLSATDFTPIPTAILDLYNATEN